MKLVIALVALLFAQGCGCEEIDTGHVGVVKKWGAVQGDTVPEGLQFTGFGVDIEQVSNQLQAVELVAEASSKDLQKVTAKILVPYTIAATLAPKVVQRLGGNTGLVDRILSPAIQESAKAATAGYTAEELITKRGEVKTKIVEGLVAFVAASLKEKDIVGAVTIGNVAITDFDFSADFNAAIEAKVKTEQQALQAVQEKVRTITQAEAQEAVAKTQANAVAYAITSKADAEATSMLKTADAKAKAIKLVSESVSGKSDFLALKKIEKWNGDVPKFTGANAVPLLDMKQ